MFEMLQVNFLATVVHAAGTALVAGLLLPLSRTMPGRFLRLWATAWLCRTAGLMVLFLSAGTPSELRGPLAFGYLLAGYLFAFLVWAGCRRLVLDRELQRSDWLILTGPVLLAVIVPVWFHDQMRHGLAVHSAVMASLFLMALVQAVRFPRSTTGPAVGRWVVRGALAVLALLYLHYAVVLGLLSAAPPQSFEYLLLARLYNVLLETALAFGMVVLAADRTRELLEEQNRALAAAAAELDAVARTDPLTGLLNRRGFEQMAADHARTPTPGAVAVLDLNDLKLLNDAHGHPAGDAALQLLARALRSRFRVTDPICRTGGDEFVVIFSGGSSTDLCRRLAGLELELAGQRLPGLPNPTDISVAWGVAGLEDDLLAAAAAADRAMYARKRLMKAPDRTPV